MRQPIGFGGDPWFSWKYTKNKNFIDMLKIQFLLFSIGRMQ